ncbi:hypothetical protein L1049_027536 [Liquidambar formosana]|uniref:Endonuclease/exonuclease/phosphatase domain-containing protein n=1 Tax=Liquidambar formosana TaxID=63359 RepID=A0AAP0RHK9_LIQFO
MGEGRVGKELSHTTGSGLASTAITPAVSHPTQLIRFLSSRAHILSEKWGNVPVVLAGDFNFTPQSAIYKFLSKSELNIMLYDRRELSGQKSCHPTEVFGGKRDMGSLFILRDRFLKYCWTDEEVKVATGNTESKVAVHPLKLNSSYAALKGSTSTRGSNGEPLATSYHSKFLGTVDYLWYSDGVVPTRVLDTLPIDILRRTGGLPCTGKDSSRFDSLMLLELRLHEASLQVKSRNTCTSNFSFPPHKAEELNLAKNWSGGFLSLSKIQFCHRIGYS